MAVGAHLTYRSHRSRQCAAELHHRSTLAFEALKSEPRVSESKIAATTFATQTSGPTMVLAFGMSVPPTRVGARRGHHPQRICSIHPMVGYRPIDIQPGRAFTGTWCLAASLMLNRVLPNACWHKHGILGFTDPCHILGFAK